MDLQVKNPKTSDDFQAMCPRAPLPWTEGAGRERWSIVDATGEEICCFDGSAEDTPALMGMILVAVNTCGGFKAERVS